METTTIIISLISAIIGSCLTAWFQKKKDKHELIFQKKYEAYSNLIIAYHNNVTYNNILKSNEELIKSQQNYTAMQRISGLIASDLVLTRSKKFYEIKHGEGTNEAMEDLVAAMRKDLSGWQKLDNATILKKK